MSARHTALMNHRERELARREAAVAKQERAVKKRENKLRKMHVALAVTKHRPAYEPRSLQAERLDTFDFSKFNRADCKLLREFVRAADSVTGSTITYGGFTCVVDVCANCGAYMQYDLMPGRLMSWRDGWHLIASCGHFLHVRVHAKVFERLTALL